jgi:hypothetical protein
MAWTNPDTHIWAVSEVVSAANMNTFLRLNLDYLYGDTVWTTMAVFTNGWAQNSPLPRYRLVGSLVVCVGSIHSGTVNTVAFTFPVGYRPQILIGVPCNSNSAFGVVQVDTTGALTPLIGSNVFFDLSSVIFSTLP